ncbi:phospholipid/cholesterol/gamma-HCH transport system permease protein [Novosphingobium sediminicola]|uniref:Phospholipid/cholesterol/gamma-HCH transport system permease protein n=2 Tax=Novosphingobium sediminicola TaxID=563162 RepID=A0A7W6CD57_9SPHN|nr:phospholipid/cholesterol/gamma-HCH transport system permease protein [Novosphingobium sediminicola]
MIFAHKVDYMAPDCEFLLATDADGKSTLTLSGVLTIASVGTLDHAMRRENPQFSDLDIAGLEELDTAGAWLVWRLARDAGAQVVGASEKAERLMSAVKCCSGDAPIAPPRAPPLFRIVETVGLVMIGLWRGSGAILSFLGALISALGNVIRHPSRIRWTALVRQTELVGVDALAIVGLMSFLVGVVIAQQGAVQLQQFGAEIYTVNLTGRISLRELGVLMTAIMVAGRSGSAFAAQIGTMKLTEEIDAMRTIGVSPMEALVLPRVMAAVVMMPLLGLYSALIAIVGGATISAFTLDIPFFNFLARVQEVVPLIDLWVGLIKGPVFGLIVAMTGCYQGMQVKGSSEEVGLRTTQAVVQAIFAVIVIDAFFAVFFSEVGWI